MTRKEKQTSIHVWVLLIVILAAWSLPVPNALMFIVAKTIMFLIIMLFSLAIGYNGWTPDKWLKKTID